MGPRLGLSLRTVQTALSKVDGPVEFSARPGSQSGTQQARLSEDRGVVQAGGRAENLSALVLWLPVDETGAVSDDVARAYLEAFVEIFVSVSEGIVPWIDGLLVRAAAEPTSPTYLESQLSSRHQFKGVLSRAYTPPMFSLTVVADNPTDP